MVAHFFKPGPYDEGTQQFGFLAVVQFFRLAAPSAS